jgi:hypothetical protein
MPNRAQAAGTAQSYSGASEAVTEGDLAPALLGGEFYNDRYTIEAYLEDGSEVYSSVFISNFGMGDQKLKFKSRVKLSDKRVLRGGDAEKAKDDWKFTKSPFSLEADGQKISGTPEKLLVSGSGEGYTFELTYEASVAPWKPGNGRVTFGSADKFVETIHIQPKSTVTGWIEVDGQRKEVKGYGYAQRTFGNVAPHEQATRQLDIRAIDGDMVLYMRHFKVPAESGGAEMGYILVAKGGKIVFQSTDFEPQFADFAVDDKHENKYEVPQKVLVSDSQGGSTLKLGIVAKKQRKREDKREKSSAMEKAVISRFAKPVTYTYSAAFEVEVSGSNAAKGKGKAVFEMHHINK